MLAKLNDEMQVTNDHVHNAKMNQHALLQQHLDDTAQARMMLQNYVECKRRKYQTMHGFESCIVIVRQACSCKKEQEGTLVG